MKLLPTWVGTKTRGVETPCLTSSKVNKIHLPAPLMLSSRLCLVFFNLFKKCKNDKLMWLLLVATRKITSNFTHLQVMSCNLNFWWVKMITNNGGCTSNKLKLMAAPKWETPFWCFDVQSPPLSHKHFFIDSRNIFQVDSTPSPS